ncbi:N-acetylmuramoyl-L-alanine amidase [Desulfovibrio intestinalis]|uniref:N-acetylmuramoyl-L-alanine amidase n=1 Tax=Desulfovibrio intestinalis TaxID=58621 RepID=A0A7W8C4U1_9BACT|nr:N-acetylmuramoyl-L-alanine amidase [Desulfovibrio intestinalis]
MASKAKASQIQGGAQAKTQPKSPQQRPKDRPADNAHGSGAMTQPRHGLKRLAPPLFFLLALCLLVVFFYDTGYTSLPPTAKRYDTAKAGIESLRMDVKRANLREPWEKLAAEFRAIYDADPGWPNRPAALFRAAESLEELARRSFAKADARKAIECYEAVALRHADSRLADDALFHAAKLRAAWFKDDKGALELLNRIKSQYPKGDMLPEALALEKTLQASAQGRTAPEARQIAAAESKPAVEDSSPSAAMPASTQDKDKKRSDEAPSATAGQTTPASKLAASPAALLPQDQLLPRYRKAKSDMEALSADKIRSCWRQPWEELAAEFLLIYQSRKNWAISPGALFRAASSQESLANCSHLAAEYRQARDLYLSLAQEFPKSALADDALLRAAAIDADRLNQPGEALELLDAIATLYSHGDMLPQAKTMRARLTGVAENADPASAKSGAASARDTSPEVHMLSWNSLNKNSVEIVLDLSAPARYRAKLEEGKKGAASSLYLEFEDASVVKDVSQGVTVKGSLLQSVRVRDRKGGGAIMQFSFRDVRRFDTQLESNPCRIILRVAAGSTPLPPRQGASAGFAQQDASPKADASASEPRHVNDMARQLGLTVRTVFIDAGHGGRDPGTSHNGILERVITLDVATTLGRLLQANGVEVVYSRTNDTGLSLRERTTRANAAGADLFVSIHVNANDDKSVNGFETYYLDLAENTDSARVAALENTGSDHRLGDMQKMLADVMLNTRVDESRKLAQDVQRLTLFRLKKREYTVRNNGVKSAPFHVLLGAQMPAVLVELGYCTHADEARNLANAKYRLALAEGLAEGILAYKDRLLKKRTAQNSLTPESAGAM